MTSEATVAARIDPHRGERNFYSAMALACALAVFAGFARTYYLRDASDLPPLSALVHLHGAIFTAWIVLFVAQVSLVRLDRRDWHRRLGLLGAALAVSMVWVGAVVAIGAAVAGKSAPGIPPLDFLASQMESLLQFAVLVGLAIYFRRRSDTHKRLMLLATISLLSPAIVRFRLQTFGIEGVGLAWMFEAWLIVDLFILASVLYDLAKRGRVHPANAWGGIIMVASQPLRLMIGQTAGWHSVAIWLTTQ